jgi:hypothetical protein
MTHAKDAGLRVQDWQIASLPVQRGMRISLFWEETHGE